VLGHGAHPDPAGHLAGLLGARNGGPLVIASVTGTDADPQPRGGQVEKLVAAGVMVADSNAEAAELAVTVVGRSAR
jgi:FdrA protein